MIGVLAALFLAAAAAANLTIAELGPSAAPWVALGLVALDLVTRDALHDRVEGLARVALLAALVAGGALIAYLVNRDAGDVALASSAAFAAALTVDSLVYHAARRLPWLERSNLSNVASAIVDSVVFVAIAFPGFLEDVALSQATAKIAGGLVFALLLERLLRPAPATR